MRGSQVGATRVVSTMEEGAFREQPSGRVQPWSTEEAKACFLSSRSCWAPHYAPPHYRSCWVPHMRMLLRICSCTLAQL